MGETCLNALSLFVNSLTNEQGAFLLGILENTAIEYQEEQLSRLLLGKNKNIQSNSSDDLEFSQEIIWELVNHLDDRLDSGDLNDKEELPTNAAALFSPKKKRVSDIV